MAVPRAPRGTLTSPGVARASWQRDWACPACPCPLQLPGLPGCPYELWSTASRLGPCCSNHRALQLKHSRATRGALSSWEIMEPSEEKQLEKKIRSERYHKAGWNSHRRSASKGWILSAQDFKFWKQDPQPLYPGRFLKSSQQSHPRGCLQHCSPHW